MHYEHTFIYVYFLALYPPWVDLFHCHWYIGAGETRFCAAESVSVGIFPLYKYTVIYTEIVFCAPVFVFVLDLIFGCVCACVRRIKWTAMGAKGEQYLLWTRSVLSLFEAY